MSAATATMILSEWIDQLHVLSSPYMKSVMQAYQVYVKECNILEPQLLKWANPSGDYIHSPMNNYPLSSLHSAGLVVLIYLTLVLFLTLLMKCSGCRGLNLKWLQYLYNPLQMMLCSYMAIETGLLAWRNNYNLVCNVYDARHPVMGTIAWWFLMSKVLDFMDTFMIICTAKWRQLTLLHVYHHVSVFSVFWMFFKAAYDGDIYITILGNALVHALMYTYYFLSLHTKDIWWKQYLTAIQMIQFVTFLLHGYYVLSCPSFPQPITLMYMVYIQSLFWLFLHFFIQSYVVKKKNQDSRQDNENKSKKNKKKYN